MPDSTPDQAGGDALWRRAGEVLVGGVNSPVRAFTQMGEQPRFLCRGKGALVYDEQDREYIDYLGSWGPLLLGHAHPPTLRAVGRQLEQGLGFGACSPLEVEWAERVCAALPWVEKVRMTCSGTEAGMTAVRLARAHSGRSLVVKFAGCYHGHFDSMLVRAGSGALTHGVLDSAGVPEELVAATLVLPFNDTAALQAAFAEHQIGAVILEVVPGNMGLILPDAGFLAAVQRLCASSGAVLVADEVMTGFRVHPQGACARFGLEPDLVMLGKVVGGGLPVGAVGGRADIMERLAPLGDVYQAGTLAGNPLAVAAGIATLDAIEDGLYPRLEEYGRELIQGCVRAAGSCGIELSGQVCGGMFGLYFAPAPPRCLDEARAAATDSYAAFFRAMLERGVYLAPSAFEAGFLSAAHTERELRLTLQAAERSFAAMAA